jgi:zinc protease
MKAGCLAFTLAVAAMVQTPVVTQAPATASGRATQPPAVLQHGTSPLITFRILFMTGGAFDPPGKEGLASLTAAMLAEGGSQRKTYQQILDEMYPMATSVNWQADKEMTVFTGTTHVETLDRFYGLMRDMLLEPGFRQEDFTRVRDEAVNFLKVSLRESNDEELGKEYLYTLVYEGHPYGHHNRGSVSSLQKLTVDDVRAFYLEHYTRANVVLGLAGNYPNGFAEKVEADLARLPVGAADTARFEPPPLHRGTRMTILTRDTRSTALSLGFPIDVNRASPDWPAVAVAVSYLGQHRTSNGYLYGWLREARGLNYGDYAYSEYFPRGMFQFTPDPNLARQQQIFQIWIRPVEANTGVFTLRAALYAYDTFVRNGLSREAFEATRQFLTKYANILTQTQSARLGSALDSRYYGNGDYTTYLRESLAKLTVDDVNRAIRQHLATDRMQIVIVTKDPTPFEDAVAKNTPSPITYNSPKPKEIADEDAIIQTYRINVKPEDVSVVPVERAFQ